jgi:hypothetical protein
MTAVCIRCRHVQITIKYIDSSPYAGHMAVEYLLRLRLLRDLDKEIDTNTTVLGIIFSDILAYVRRLFSILDMADNIDFYHHSCHCTAQYFPFFAIRLALTPTIIFHYMQTQDWLSSVSEETACYDDGS